MRSMRPVPLVQLCRDDFYILLNRLAAISERDYTVARNSVSYSTLTLLGAICRLLRDGPPEGTAMAECTGARAPPRKHDVSAQVIRGKEKQS